MSGCPLCNHVGLIRSSIGAPEIVACPHCTPRLDDGSQVACCRGCDHPLSASDIAAAQTVCFVCRGGEQGE